MNLARKDAAGAKKELKLDERRLKLVDVLDQHHANKLVARGQQLVKNITNNKFWEMENKIISLQTENSQLENENSELKEKIASKLRNEKNLKQQ